MHPKHIGKYLLLGEIGRGSSAIVYLAEDPFNQRKVAIKVEHFEGASDDEEESRLRTLFLNEASLAGKLHHPNIVTLYDAVFDEAQRYMVMEYVPGGSLKRYCTEANLLPMRQVVMTGFKCARALDYAFQHGVIHRDIKPANILVGEDHETKISDFGTAHIAHSPATQLGGFLGSPAYMAPEQISEHAPSVQSDIYSLGVVLYELLSGRLPYPAGDSAAMIEQILTTQADSLAGLRPEIPARLIAIVECAMHKDPAQRFASWFDMARELIDTFPQLESAANEITTSEKLARLRELDFFGGFRDPDLLEIVRNARWQQQSRGAPLVDENDDAQAFHIVVVGEAKVMRANCFVAALKAGDSFGNLGHFDNAQRGAALIAVSEVQLLTLENDKLVEMSEGCQLRFTRAFLRTLAARDMASRVVRSLHEFPR